MGAVVMPLILVGILASLVGGVRARTHRTFWRNTGISLLLLVWCGSTPVVGNYLLTALEHRYTPLRGLPAECNTIVVLAGSLLSNTCGGSEEKLGETSLRRCLEAIRLYKANNRPKLIVSGGQSTDRIPPEPPARLMAAFLVEWGVNAEDILLETESFNTLENSMKTAYLLETLARNQIVLVTDAAHMSRAVKCFELRGISVTPAPCNYQGVWPPESWRWFVPSPHGLLKTQYACHEIFGAMWYSLVYSRQAVPEREVLAH